jgi:tetratricopeptide (TPR) repeat protein
MMLRRSAATAASVTWLVPAMIVAGSLAVPGDLSVQASSQPPSPPQERISSDWKRITSGDLSVVGDTSENELRSALTALEDFRAALLNMFPGLRLASDVPTTLVVFRDNASFQRFKPRDARGRVQQWVGGYFMALPDINYMVLSGWANRETTFRTLFHEYTHYVVHRNTRSVPVWLNEGLAEFYSTFRSKYRGEEGSLIGEPPVSLVRVLRNGPLIPLRELLSDEGARKIFKSQHRIGMFYAQSWALVHYLQMAGWNKGTANLGTYLRALETGTPEQAVHAAFNMSLRQLESELTKYVQKFSFPALMLPPPPKRDGEAPRASRLLESEARYVRGDLLTRLAAESEAEEELSKALQENPTDIPTQVALARLRIDQDRHGEAIPMLQKAAATDAASFPAQFYLATAFMADERRDEAAIAYQTAIKLQPLSAAAWFGLSRSALALGRDDVADTALERVLGIDSNPSWFRQRAYFAYRTGRHATIARDVRKYLDAEGWGNESAPYLAFLAAIAHWRAGQPAEADAILSEAALVIKEGSWQERLLQLMQDRLPAETVISRARDNDERTEAYAYAGIKAALASRLDDARRYLQWVKERGSRNFVEYGMAVADLKRLDATTNSK